MLILPLGYTVREVFAAGGNPYGASFVTGHTVTGPDEHALAVARYQGQRLARFAAVIADARRNGVFAVELAEPGELRRPDEPQRHRLGPSRLSRPTIRASASRQLRARGRCTARR